MTMAMISGQMQPLINFFTAFSFCTSAKINADIPVISQYWMMIYGSASNT